MFAATGSASGDESRRRSAGWLRPAAARDPTAAPATAPAGSAPIARQRELSLVAIMIVLGALVSLAGAPVPDRSTTSARSRSSRRSSPSPRSARRSSCITRNVDLSVEATMGLVAYCRRRTPRATRLRRARARSLFGHRARARPRDGQRVRSSRSSGSRRSSPRSGTLSIFRGIDYLVAGSHQVAAGGPAGRLHGRRPRRVLGIPVFVVVAIVVVVIGSVILRSTRFGRQVYAVGSNPEAAAILGIPSRLVVFVAFSLCGLLAGVAGRHVGHRVRDDQRDVRDRVRAGRSSPRSSSAA